MSHTPNHNIRIVCPIEHYSYDVRAEQPEGIDRTNTSPVSRIRSALDEMSANLWERDPPDVSHPYV